VDFDIFKWVRSKFWVFNYNEWINYNVKKIYPQDEFIIYRCVQGLTWMQDKFHKIESRGYKLMSYLVHLYLSMQVSHATRKTFQFWVIFHWIFFLMGSQKKFKSYHEFVQEIRHTNFTTQIFNDESYFPCTSSKNVLQSIGLSLWNFKT